MQKSKSLPALDSLRGIACMMVVYFHSGWITGTQALTGTGQLGVMVFFTLSGFLMAHNYLPGELSAKYWLAFMVRRVMRVYPLYVMVVLMVAVAGVTLHNPYLAQFNAARVTDHLLLRNAISVFWTIPIEIKFYAAFAITAPILLVAPASYTLPAIIAIWCALVWAGIPAEKAAFLPYVPFFTSGIMAAALHGIKLRQPEILFCISAALLLAFSGVDELWNHTGYFSLLTCLLIIGLLSSGGRIKAIFTNPVLRFMGNISYSLYLIHMFIFVACFYWPVQRSGAHAAVIIAATIGAATLLHYAIEIPFHKAGIILSKKIASKK